jgi:hypothetical protein
MIEYPDWLKREIDKLAATPWPLFDAEYAKILVGQGFVLVSPQYIDLEREDQQPQSS